MTILGARKHTCINTDVCDEPNVREACQKAIKSSSCRYKTNLNNRETSATITNALMKHRERQGQGDKNQASLAWDLEDLVKVGKDCTFCPYYACVKTLNEVADLVFCPYNYIIEPTIRHTMNLSIKDSVVIVDEGHNIEDNARDAMQQEFTLEELIIACGDFKKLAQDQVKMRSNTQLQNLTSRLIGWVNRQHKAVKYKKPDSEWSTLYTYKLSVDDVIDLITESQIRTASLIKNYWENISDVMGAKDDDPDEYLGDETEGEKMKHPSFSSVATVEKLLYLLQYLLQEDNPAKRMEDYAAYICVEGAEGMRADAAEALELEEQTTDKWIGGGASRKPPRGGKRNLFLDFEVKNAAIQLKFVCLSSAVAFQEVADESRCVLITSGTLAPLNTFASELGTTFPITLEANHVIKPDRMFNVCVAQTQYQDALGDSVLEICRVVPKGVLCFFASYSTMKRIMRRWEVTGLLEKLGEYKEIVKEPSYSGDMEKAMRQYFRAIYETDIFKARYPNFSGALFCAVYRGKVAEGVDFADDRARTVITIGIPYSNFGSLEVKEKMLYNNRFAQTKGLIAGRQWYETQAYRALNQALGRCMRHMDDWAALIMLDSRFNRHNSSSLSKWIKNNLVFHNDFAFMLKELKTFVGKMVEATPAMGRPSIEELIIDDDVNLRSGDSQRINDYDLVRNQLLETMKRPTFTTMGRDRAMGVGTPDGASGMPPEWRTRPETGSDHRKPTVSSAGADEGANTSSRDDQKSDSEDDTQAGTNNLDKDGSGSSNSNEDSGSKTSNSGSSADSQGTSNKRSKRKKKKKEGRSNFQWKKHIRPTGNSFRDFIRGLKVRTKRKDESSSDTDPEMMGEVPAHPVTDGTDYFDQYDVSEDEAEVPESPDEEPETVAVGPEISDIFTTYIDPNREEPETSMPKTTVEFLQDRSGSSSTTSSGSSSGEEGEDTAVPEVNRTPPKKEDAGKSQRKRKASSGANQRKRRR